MSEYNIPLLRKTLEHIEAHPNEWSQRVWGQRIVGCGTTYCFAGTAAVLSGYEPAWEKFTGDDGAERYAMSHVIDPETGGSRGVEQIGAALLGLDLHDADDNMNSEAGRIFYSMVDTPEQLRSLVESVVRERL